MLDIYKSVTCLFIFIVFVVFLTEAFCKPKSISVKYEILPENPALHTVSKKDLLVGDSKLNHSYGNPILFQYKLLDHRKFCFQGLTISFPTLQTELKTLAPAKGAFNI